MTQGVLPFQYEVSGSACGMTALAGLPAYLDLAAVAGLAGAISAVFRYLGAFHDPEEEAKRVQGKAFIQAPKEVLKALYRVNQELVAFKQARAPQRSATVDMDATLIETYKRLALFCYQGYAAYQPLTLHWHERRVVLHSEFRDGNVPAGFEPVRVLGSEPASSAQRCREGVLAYRYGRL